MLKQFYFILVLRLFTAYGIFCTGSSHRELDFARSSHRKLDLARSSYCKLDLAHSVISVETKEPRRISALVDSQ